MGDVHDQKWWFRQGCLATASAYGHAIGDEEVHAMWTVLHMGRCLQPLMSLAAVKGQEEKQAPAPATTAATTREDDEDEALTQEARQQLPSGVTVAVHRNKKRKEFSPVKCDQCHEWIGKHGERTGYCGCSDVPKTMCPQCGLVWDGAGQCVHSPLRSQSLSQPLYSTPPIPPTPPPKL